MYPDNLQYKNAVVNGFFDPAEIKTGFTASIQDGEPVFEPGNRAIVFKVTDNKTGLKKALKFFAVEDKNRFFRYENVGRYLRQINSSYFVDFDFFNKLIYVPNRGTEGGEYYPGVVMDWVSGMTLGTYLKQRCERMDKKSIVELTENFRELSLFLLTNGIGHGDLKHDNIIVTSEGRLVLVDYDCLFTPAFAGMMATELGTDSFQHPLRSANDFNERIDDFSILNIYTSLLALSRLPELYKNFNDQQNLIFTRKDFIDPDESELFAALAKDPEIRICSYFLKRACKSSSIYISELLDILKGNFPKPTLLISQYPVKAMAGEPVVIKWITSYVDFVELDGAHEEREGEIKCEFLEETIVNFVFGNEIVQQTKEYEVKLYKRPVITVFSSDDMVIAGGTSTRIFWEVADAGRVELMIDGVSRDIDFQGYLNVSPENDSTYKLNVIGLDHKTRASAVLRVLVKREVAITAFYAQDIFIIESLRTNLKWDVKNADEIIIESSRGERFEQLKGESLEVQPRQNIIYTLTARNDLFSSTSKCEISVDPLPRFAMTLPKIVMDNESLIPEFPGIKVLKANSEQSKRLFEEVFGEMRGTKIKRSFFKRIFS